MWKSVWPHHCKKIPECKRIDFTFGGIYTFRQYFTDIFSLFSHGCCRFAEFVQGSSHLTQDEVMDYSQVSDFDEEMMNETLEGVPRTESPDQQAQLTDDDSSDDTTD